jgi:hypothetical protein
MIPPLHDPEIAFAPIPTTQRTSGQTYNPGAGCGHSIDQRSSRVDPVDIAVSWVCKRSL